MGRASESDVQGTKCFARARDPFRRQDSNRGGAADTLTEEIARRLAASQAHREAPKEDPLMNAPTSLTSCKG
jgi:hypothetical protein